MLLQTSTCRSRFLFASSQHFGRIVSVINVFGPKTDELTEVLPPVAGWRQQMCLIASVYFYAAENCWAKFSTALPKRPVYDMGAFKNHALSASLMSARHSHKWHSWTTMVDISRPRDRAVNFVARSARSVVVWSSLRTSGSWPPSCRSLSALAWWTCNNAIACRAEAAFPQAT